MFADQRFYAFLVSPMRAWT